MVLDFINDNSNCCWWNSVVNCNHVLLHDFQKVASDFHHFSTFVSLNLFISWSNASAQWLLLCALGSRHWLDYCEGPKLDDMLRFVWKMTRKSLKKRRSFLRFILGKIHVKDDIGGLVSDNASLVSELTSRQLRWLRLGLFRCKKRGLQNLTNM